MQGNWRVKLTGIVSDAKRVTPKMIKFNLTSERTTPKGVELSTITIIKSDELDTPEYRNGRVAVVDGELREHRWLSKEGKQCSSFEVFAFDVGYYNEDQ